MLKPIPRSTRAAVPPVLLALLSVAPPALRGQEAHVHDDGTIHHHEGLHFTHPLVAESVSPDTKVRVDVQHFELPDGDVENSTVVEAEYAFHRTFSIEVALPYSYGQTEFGNLEVTFKVANYAFEEAGVLLGSGLALGAPTNGTPEAPVPDPLLARSVVPSPRFHTGGGGVDATLGTDEWELSPFLNAGLKRGRLELVGWGILDIPFGAAEEEPDPEAPEGDEHAHGEGVGLSYNLSALVALSSRVEGVLELDGAGGVTGAAVGEDVASLSPGIRVRPFAGRPLVLGASVGFPLTSEEAFDARLKASLFWHF